MTKNRRLGAFVGMSCFTLMLMAAASVLGCSSAESPESPESPKSDPPTMPGPSGATCPDPAPTYEGFAEGFFASYCVRCHSSTALGSARHGAPKSTNFDTLEGIQAASLDMLDQLAAAGPLQQNTFMPPDEPEPSRAERESLGEWLACDRPR